MKKCSKKNSCNTCWVTRWLGYLLLSSPFIALVIYVVAMGGWGDLAFITGVVVSVCGLILGGVYLIDRGNGYK